MRRNGTMGFISSPLGYDLEGVFVELGIRIVVWYEEPHVSSMTSFTRQHSGITGLQQATGRAKFLSFGHSCKDLEIDVSQ